LFNTAAGFYVPMIVTPEFLVSEATEAIADWRLPIADSKRSTGTS